MFLVGYVFSRLFFAMSLLGFACMAVSLHNVFCLAICIDSHALLYSPQVAAWATGDPVRYPMLLLPVIFGI